MNVLRIFRSLSRRPERAEGSLSCSRRLYQTRTANERLQFVDGSGCVLTDSGGNRYLDFSTGPKRNPFGHTGNLEEVCEEIGQELPETGESKPALNVQWDDPFGTKGTNQSVPLQEAWGRLEQEIAKSLEETMGKDVSIRLCGLDSGVDYALQILRLRQILQWNAEKKPEITRCLQYRGFDENHKHPWQRSFSCNQRSTGEAAHGGRKPTAKSRIPRDCLVDDTGRCPCWQDLVHVPSQDRSPNDSVICFQDSSHGSSVAGLSLSHDPVFRALLNRQVPNVLFSHFNDVNDAARFISEDSPGVIVESVQWDTMKFADASFLRALRQMCSESKSILTVDERSFAPGYNGTGWTHASAHVSPDILLGRVPVSNMFQPIEFVAVSSGLEQYARLLRQAIPDHVTVSQLDDCAAAMKLLNSKAFKELIRERGRILIGLSRSLQARYPHLIKDVSHGIEPGLAVAFHFEWESRAIVEECRKLGLLVECCGRNLQTVRMCPPLVVSSDELHNGISILEKALQSSELL
eukprot:gb/GECG01008358.1/.p1 GENE.gb/GECG01008358.1/~~gb/GECG01008358.1/.p1  ORF type:complete len:521 (+),score=45.66 gb/GECG01008358.1/:1-1563(+)